MSSPNPETPRLALDVRATNLAGMSGPMLKPRPTSSVSFWRPKIFDPIGFQTPCEEVFGPQKQKVFGRLGIMKSYETWDILKDSTGDRQISEASTLV